jgi:GNAT superfamily N-acetyltransferase
VISYRPPERLARHHDVSDFECTSADQTDWLRNYAKMADQAGTSTVFVVTDDSGQSVVAYYAWCMASVNIESAPPRFRKGAGQYPQPVALLSRLGVDLRHEGHGLGSALMRDMFSRLIELSETIGCRGVLIHAESQRAKEWYLHVVPEFEPSPTDSLHLMLLMKDIRKTVKAR